MNRMSKLVTVKDNYPQEVRMETLFQFIFAVQSAKPYFVINIDTSRNYHSRVFSGVVQSGDG